MTSPSLSSSSLTQRGDRIPCFVSLSFAVCHHYIVLRTFLSHSSCHTFFMPFRIDLHAHFAQPNTSSRQSYKISFQLQFLSYRSHQTMRSIFFIFFFSFSFCHWQWHISLSPSLSLSFSFLCICLSIYFCSLSHHCCTAFHVYYN